MAFKEAKPFLFIVGLIGILALFLYPPLALLPAGLFAYILYFFRDPERSVPTDPRAIVAASDGKVIGVDEVVENILTKQKMKRVAVFLSVFDVHVNRTPYEGKVTQITYQPGEFLDARHGEVDLRNENQNWLLETPHGPMVVRQLAGLIARRIVGWKKMGDTLTKGERFGMIRFGSRTDVYLPLECEVLVKAGERVQGGSTIIAKWPENISK